MWWRADSLYIHWSFPRNQYKQTALSLRFCNSSTHHRTTKTLSFSDLLISLEGLYCQTSCVLTEKYTRADFITCTLTVNTQHTKKQCFQIQRVTTYKIYTIKWDCQPNYAMLKYNIFCYDTVLWNLSDSTRRTGVW